MSEAKQHFERVRNSVVAAVITLASIPVVRAQTGDPTPIYLDPKRPIEKRVDDLMSRMTLKEKVGQLNLPCVYVHELGKSIPSKMEGCKKFAAGTYTNEIGPACGFFTLANEILHKGARQQAEYFNELQKIALTQTRLKIPVMQDEEGTHGGHVSRWHGFSGRPGGGQFLRPRSGQGDLRGVGGRSPSRRHPHAIDPGDGSGQRSAHGAKRGSLHGRSLPLHAHRRDHRAQRKDPTSLLLTRLLRC